MDWWSTITQIPGIGAVLRLLRRWWLRMFGQSSAHVFRDLEALQFAYPRDKVFEGEGEVHALWLSGHGVLPFLDEDKANIERLILASPDWEYLPFYEESLGQERGYPDEIRQMVGRADEVGAEVRICPKFPGTKLTFYRPDSWWAGWVRSEPTLPFMDLRGQPVFQLRLRRDRELFGRLWGVYEDLWAVSHDPEEVL